MASPRQTWAGLRPASRVLAVTIPVVLLAAVVAAVVLLGAPSSPPTVAVGSTSSPTTSAIPLPPTPTLEPTPTGATPSPTPSPSPPGADPILGTDGRLTILLLGSDYRPAHPGNRTDAIMVVSVDPTTGATAAFSIPRDTTRFPLPSGGVFAPKVNGLYQHYASTVGHPDKNMELAISNAFGIEVDGSVFIGFEGVQRLVDAVGGVDITLTHAYYDAHYWVNNHHQGWGLPAGTSHLNGASAIILARSRKGDNDFERARRQQLLVMAALTKVRTLGPGALVKLLQIAADTVRTDLPLASSVALFQIISSADLAHARRNVFGPRTYATSQGGTSFSLTIPVCRAWVARNFPPIRPNGSWSPSPTPLP
jgi:LCP family protein required for cell wall assembly